MRITSPMPPKAMKVPLATFSMAFSPVAALTLSSTEVASGESRMRSWIFSDAAWIALHSSSVCATTCLPKR